MTLRHTRPPALATWLLRVAAPTADRAFLLADVQEEFERIASARGVRAARSWYWDQALTSLRPLFSDRAIRLGRRLSSTPRLSRGLVTDLAQGFRWTCRHPSTVLTVVVTLAVAFATTLAALAIINAVALRPLPFTSPDRIVAIRVTGPTLSRNVRSSSRPDFEDWRERARTFDVLSAWAPLELRLTGRGDPREIDGVRVAPDFDRVFGLRPLAGRLFTDDDYRTATPHVVLITHAFWNSEFGARPDAIGQTVNLNGQAHEIVGVLPDLVTQYPLQRHDLWLPLIPRPAAFWEHSRGTGWLSVVGRVRDDQTLGAAAAELTTIARSLAIDHAATNRAKTDAELTPVRDEIVGPVTPMLQLLAAALAAVLLIACGNIANLLLATLARRRREFAVRAAIGAAGSRLASQLVGETLLMSGAAAVCGLALSPLLVRAFVGLYPGQLPRAVAAGVDATALGGAAVLAAAATLLLALPQALRARRIKAGTETGSLTRTTAGRGDRAISASLVAVQVALSFVLIVAGIGFVRTLDLLHRVDTGYDADGILAFTLPPASEEGTAAAALQFYDEVVHQIGALPGVRGAAAAVAVPMMTGGWAFGVRPPGATADVLVEVNLTSPEFFDVLGVQVVEGRLLSLDEQRRAKDVAVVNEPLARLLGGNVVGTRMNYSGTSWQIVGVIRGIRERPRSDPAPELILPWHLAGRRPQTIVVRAASGDPLALLPAITARIHAMDATAPLGDAGRLEDRVRNALAAERFRATLLASLALVAVGLAALGAYSVTAHTVARRTREYGIRLALGEPPRSIGRKALSTALVPASLGVMAGAALAMGTARWIESLLYEVRGTEPGVMAGTALGLLALALLAGASSARRAARIDPVVTLLQE